MRLLLDRGADINQADRQACTPLYMAAGDGHEAIVRLLLDRGASIAQCDKCGTPLHRAAYKGYPRVIELLLRRGTDAKVKEMQQTALDVAKQYKNLLCAAARSAAADWASVLARAFWAARRSSRFRASAAGNSVV